MTITRISEVNREYYAGLVPEDILNDEDLIILGMISDEGEACAALAVRINGSMAYIEWLYTAPEFREQGAATELLDVMLKEDDLLQSPAANSSLYKLYCQLTELMQNQHPYTDSELSRENLAQMIGTNSRYLADAIREYAGNISLGEYLDGWRIRHSARLLADTDDPVGVIGDLSGFSSRSHFNALFREHYKMTPSEYRKIAKEKIIPAQQPRTA